MLGDSGTANQNARNVRDAYYNFAATNGPADFWLVVGNDFGAITSGAITSRVALLLVNLPPLAGSDTIYRFPGEGVVVEVVDLLANDSDVDGDSIFFAGVSPRSVQGAEVSMVGRYIRYLPEGGASTSADTFTYTVADTRGSTALGVVTVLIPDNAPPIIAPIPDFIVNVLDRLAFTNVVIDANIPADRLTHFLETGAPTNARIHPDSGVFLWRPTREQAPSTNAITVLVSDSGKPSLSDRKSFTVLVNDYIEITVGSNIVRAGESGSVPLDFFSSANLTAVTGCLRFTGSRLSDLAVEAMAPEIAALSLLVSNADSAIVTLTAAEGRTLRGTQPLARLHFTAVSGQTSAFIPLEIDSVNCTRAGTGLAPATLVNNGRVVVIGERALLEARWRGGGERQLTLYGTPGRTYAIEAAINALDAAAWTAWREVTLTNLFGIVLPETNAAPAVFYRARE